MRGNELKIDELGYVPQGWVSNPPLTLIRARALSEPGGFTAGTSLAIMQDVLTQEAHCD